MIQCENVQNEVVDHIASRSGSNIRFRGWWLILGGMKVITVNVFWDNAFLFFTDGYFQKGLQTEHFTIFTGRYLWIILGWSYYFMFQGTGLVF